MEFNVLPKAKILSPHKLNKSNQTNTQTVNVILPNQIKPDFSEISERSERTEKSEVKFVPTVDNADVVENENIHTREVNLEEPAEKLSKEDSISTINFLKLVLQSYMNNPIKYNGYVICSVPVLEHLIETLTGCDYCDIEFADGDAVCCGKVSNQILPITKIWVN